MTEPINLTARRWDNGDGSPNSHPPREALELALHRLDTGEWQADHIFVICGRVENGVGVVLFTQSGEFSSFAQTGLLESAKRLLVEH